MRPRRRLDDPGHSWASSNDRVTRSRPPAFVEDILARAERALTPYFNW